MPVVVRRKLAKGTCTGRCDSRCKSTCYDSGCGDRSAIRRCQEHERKTQEERRRREEEVIYYPVPVPVDQDQVMPYPSDIAPGGFVPDQIFLSDQDQDQSTPDFVIPCRSILGSISMTSS